jgi:prepilin-type N-terminal cleavage/methylation domain-containing protein
MQILNFQFLRLRQSSRRETISNARRGFTLVELLVAITLFSIAISIAIGGFVRALRTQRELISLIAANSNASLAIEQMAREIRTGTNFDYYGCPDATVKICDGLTFTNANDEVVVYDLDKTSGGALERIVNSTPQKITADNVSIEYLNFSLLKGIPPRITVSLGVGASHQTAPELAGNITNIQTTISSRSF